MASSGLTSNGQALAIAVGSIVALVVASGALAIAFGASLFAFLGDEMVEGIAADDTELAELVDLCGAGDLAACDELWLVSPIGSDEEAFGSTCGGTVATEQYGSCAQGGVGGDDVVVADEAALADLRGRCGAGDLVACDDLYLAAPFDSDDEEFGSTCGGTREPSFGGCAGLDDLRQACADGDLEACDDLWFESPIDSDDEEFGSTCGGRREPTFGGCSG